ncbi:MAG: hypothetical protein HN600_01000 [Bacteroidetes bacterium]|nr:hypothetical protein [Cytophagia bacterium]MBT7825146.1 hypothetical protein [Bacteroidota bacterium]
MKKSSKAHLIIILGLFVLFVGCNNSNKSALSPNFHMQEKFWDADDYNDAITQIKYKTKEGELYPCYMSIDKREVYLKLVDINNITVVAEDDALGLNHRNEYLTSMFNSYQNLYELYSILDREDKYVYPKELVEINQFGLILQRFYFKLGNDQIIKNADSPDDPSVLRVTRGNANTIVGNYLLYLDFINHEDALTPEALKLYAEGIEIYFPILIKVFPEANFHEMISKIEVLKEKTKNMDVQSALDLVLEILNGEEAIAE